MSELSSDLSDSSLSDSIYGSSGAEDDSSENKAIDMSPKRDYKLVKQVIKRGKGWSTPKNGEQVEVHFVAKLSDGTVFDSSRDRNQAFTFTVGKKQVIKGWDIGIKTMRCHEISKFTFAPEFAYGSDGLPPLVPPNETIVVEIQLFNWKIFDLTKKKDRGVCKRIITVGKGYQMPNMGSTCDIHIIGKHEDNVFEDRNVKFICGEASESDVIDGIDIAVTKMRKGEKSEVFVKPEYAFGSSGKVEFNIPNDYQKVVYELTLNDFQNIKEWYEMTDKEKLQQSELAKMKGNHYFKDSKYKLAINQYLRIASLFKKDSNEFNVNKDEQQEKADIQFDKERDRLMLFSYLNLSISYIKIENYCDAIKCCELALKKDPNNVKALFRRGLSYYGLKSYNLAKTDFESVLESEPNNKTANNYLLLSNNTIKEENQIQRNICTKMFPMSQIRSVSGDMKFEEVVDIKLENTLSADPQSDNLAPTQSTSN